jgi:hypothetical protein
VCDSPCACVGVYFFVCFFVCSLVHVFLFYIRQSKATPEFVLLPLMSLRCTLCSDLVHSHLTSLFLFVVCVYCVPSHCVGPPMQVITDFQTQNRLSADTITATSLLSFQLLDLHDISRSHIHRSVLMCLRGELLSAIEECACAQSTAQQLDIRQARHPSG